jgi:hypothetical protein
VNQKFGTTKKGLNMITQEAMSCLLWNKYVGALWIKKKKAIRRIPSYNNKEEQKEKPLNQKEGWQSHWNQS